MRSITAHFLALLALAFLVGCSTGTVTGSTGWTHTVTVGQEAIIRLPATVNAGREWRLTEYDSARLPITQRPRLVESGSRREWVARFSARSPGPADVEFTRVAVGPDANGTVGERRRYRFNVRQ